MDSVDKIDIKATTRDRIVSIVIYMMSWSRCSNAKTCSSQPVICSSNRLNFSSLRLNARRIPFHVLAMGNKIYYPLPVKPGLLLVISQVIPPRALCPEINPDLGVLQFINAKPPHHITRPESDARVALIR